ncbi:MAG: glycosyltransferase family 39 protein, partial [Anaerolineales bacterium]
MWEGPDEREHFFYVRYVAAEWRIPDAIEEYDSYAWVPTHGPLYYFVAAPFIAQLDTSDISSLPLSNPQATANDLDGLGNRNGYIHTSAEHWPYADANVRALHIARMVTAAFGALAVVAVTLLGSRISPSVGIIAGLLLASNPEFLFLGGLIQNDAPAAALATVALLFLVRYWEAPGCGRAAQVGALAVLTKASNLGLLGVAGLVILTRRRHLLRKLLSEGATIGGICLIFSAWWLGLNYVRYGDITGLVGSLTLMPGEQVNYAELPNLIGLVRFTAASSWALFGASNVLGPGWIHWLLSAIAVITGSGIFMNRLHWPLA